MGLLYKTAAHPAKVFPRKVIQNPRERFRSAEKFPLRVSKHSNPEKVAGSIAKAFLDGRVIEAEVYGEGALSCLFLALGIAQNLTEKNGGEMRITRMSTNVRTKGVLIEIEAKFRRDYKSQRKGW